MTKVIVIMNEKGGVGKTATAMALAYHLAEGGKKTALIDFDGQGHASLPCGVDSPNKLEVTISTLLNRVIRMSLCRSRKATYSKTRTAGI